MAKMIAMALFITMLSGCDVLKTLPQTTGGSVSENEAGQGIREALSQGLVKAVLQLNKEAV